MLVLIADARGSHPQPAIWESCGDAFVEPEPDFDDVPLSELLRMLTEKKCDYEVSHTACMRLLYAWYDAADEHDASPGKEEKRAEEHALQDYTAVHRHVWSGKRASQQELEELAARHKSVKERRF